VYVKSTGEIAPGNRKLLQIGAREFPEDGFGDLSQLFGSPAKTAPLFEQASLMEAPPGTEAESQEAPTTEAGTEPTSTPSQEDNYPRMIAALEQPLDAKSLAAVLHVSAAQIRIWLKRAVEEGRVRKLNKPVRYVVTTETGTLFAEDAKSNQH
jgi:predicted Rossmann fold nucleotide-binding protein DprA/Smf involved in DNA uptake